MLSTGPELIDIENLIKMILFHTATHYEAKAIIEWLSLQRTAGSEIKGLYRSHGMEYALWVSGIGKKAGRRIGEVLAFLGYDSSISKICNVGIAGCVDKNNPIGQGRWMKSVSLVDEDRKKYELCIPSTTVSAKDLITVDQPVIDGTAFVSQRGPNVWVDMECYHLREGLSQAGKDANEAFPLSSFKVVSDHLEGERIEFRSFAEKYDQTIVDHLKTFLEL